MASISFVGALTALANQITGNAPLQAFSQAKWGKPLTAKLSFRHRPELNLSALPTVLITRPKVSKRRDASGGPEGLHSVRLYFGFYQPDQDKVVGEQIGLEELIEDAINSDTSLGETADEVTILDSANDEGKQHPSCFTVMDLGILFQRQPLTDDENSTLDDFLRMHAEYDMALPDGQIDAIDDITLTP